MKLFSVIGPDSEQVKTVAARLQELSASRSDPQGRQARIVVGAGPEQHPDAVIAAVGEPSPANIEVVRAVIQAMGAVILLGRRDSLTGADGTPPGSADRLSDRSAGMWPAIPGMRWAQSPEHALELAERSGVDLQRWRSEAHRADAERADRVRIAVRLKANRLAAELTEHGVSRDAWQGLHERFVAELRVAVLEQGVLFPTVNMGVPPVPQGSELARAAGADVAALPGGYGGHSGHNGQLAQVAPRKKGKIGAGEVTATSAVAAAVGAGIGLGKIFGNPLIGGLIGVCFGLIVATIRVSEQRKAKLQREDQRRAQALRTHWSALTTDVCSRLAPLRVGEQLSRTPAA